jgi:hypothetical protein
MNYNDPRMGMDPRWYMMQQHYHPHGYSAPPPPPPRKQGQDEEIAMNLLKLNKNNSETDSGAVGVEQQQPQLTGDDLYRGSDMQRNHAAAFMHGGGMHGGGMYPPMGSVYGYPAVGFDRQMLTAASVGRDRPHVHASPMGIDEPVILTDVSFSDLLDDSTLVSMKDRDLIPDALVSVCSLDKQMHALTWNRISTFVLIHFCFNPDSLTSSTSSSYLPITVVPAFTLTLKVCCVGTIKTLQITAS